MMLGKAAATTNKESMIDDIDNTVLKVGWRLLVP